MMKRILCYGKPKHAHSIEEYIHEKYANGDERLYVWIFNNAIIKKVKDFKPTEAEIKLFDSGTKAFVQLLPKVIK